ncbi:MAG: PIN domain-containing protein [Dehalococcoidia bacterium]|nr:PIN domain-containing protein [Dehalococcoidia bacterium]
MRLVDTNVLLYAVSLSPDDTGKRRRAIELFRRHDLAVSVQVFQEFYYQATHPKRPDRLTHDDALAFLGTLMRFPIQEVTLDVFRTGVAISQRFGLSYWDGAILAAARALGCDAVYSEDLSTEQDYDGLRVINPFDDGATPIRQVER